MRALARRLEALPRSPTIAAVRDLLVDCGEIEAAIADALCRDEDDGHAAVEALHRIEVGLARRFVATLRGEAPRHPRAPLADDLLSIQPEALPRTVRLHPVEGYAQYAVYPDLYVAAALDFAATARPSRVVCAGLRTIGASLAATVHAALEACGASVTSLTLRPRGHPFARTIRMSPRLRARLAAESGGAHVAIVDEGPGLSGSSFASAAEAFAALGVPNERIVLFPSWNPDGAGLVSAGAAARWRAHARHCRTFDDDFVASGRLARAIGAASIEDISGGRWRSLLLPKAPWPAVQPQHERRKYIARVDGRRCVARFAGLGRYGWARRDRAERLAAAGWGPVPRELADGFLLLPWVPGRPMTRRRASRGLAEFAARYLAFVRSFAAPPTASVDSILEMIETNAREAAIRGSTRGWRRILGAARAVRDAPAAAVDGRALAHEWLAGPAGFVKVDAIDHHDDHFYPGACDPAWDVAAVEAEFAWTRPAAAAFVARCAQLGNDPHLGARLPFHRTAYRAFRLGYCVLAETTTRDYPDEARRFATEAGRYREGLRRSLEGAQ